MINTFTHSRSSLEKHTRFQTKMGTKTLPFEGVGGGGKLSKASPCYMNLEHFVHLQNRLNTDN